MFLLKSRFVFKGFFRTFLMADIKVQGSLEHPMISLGSLISLTILALGNTYQLKVAFTVDLPIPLFIEIFACCSDHVTSQTRK